LLTAALLTDASAAISLMPTNSISNLTCELSTLTLYTWL